MSRMGVRHCSKFSKSRLKNVQAAGKEVIFCEARLIEDQARLIENHEKIIFAEF